MTRDEKLEKLKTMLPGKSIVIDSRVGVVILLERCSLGQRGQVTEQTMTEDTVVERFYW